MSPLSLFNMTSLQLHRNPFSRFSPEKKLHNTIIAIKYKNYRDVFSDLGDLFAISHSRKGQFTVETLSTNSSLASLQTKEENWENT